MYNFNIRVYGIMINEQSQVLVTDEKRFGLKFTKFPGGGLQFGEGTIDCLLREYEEELNQKIEVISHFYTTDYFQVSAFNKQEQLISIYYLVRPKGKINFKISAGVFDFDTGLNEGQSFRWVGIDEIKPDLFYFPVDKKVAGLIKNKKWSKR